MKLGCDSLVRIAERVRPHARNSSAISTAIGLLALCSAAQRSDPFKPAKDLAARADDYLQRCSSFGFSGSVLVAIGDEVVLDEGYGIADRKTGAACTPATIFDLGSLSKQFTASTVLALDQRGTLDIDDELPKFFESVPSDKRSIKLRHLLTHTSGFPRGSEKIGSRASERDAMLATAFALPLQSKPGERHAYSNLGYDVLAAVVEVATKRSFEDVVRDCIFDPVGLKSTGFRQDGRVDAARAARGESTRYEPPPAGSMIENDLSRFEGRFDEKPLATEGWYSWGLRGAGGMLSTTGDVWAWERALRGESILNEKSKRTLFEPYRDDYACGWYVLDSPRKTPWISHGGSTASGFDVYATRYPTERVFFTTLGNTSGVVPWVHLNVGKLIFGESVAFPPPAVRLDQAQLDAACGVYSARSSGSFRVSVYDGAWLLEALDASSFGALAGAGSSLGDQRLEKSRAIVAALQRDDFAPLHAVENKQHPLSFMEGWWERLKAHHGPLKSAELLGGVTSDSAGASAVARFDFERGSELLRLVWSGQVVGGVNIGPPYPSRLRLVPTSPREAVAHDLVKGATTARVRFDLAAHELELEAGGSNVRATRER